MDAMDHSEFLDDVEHDISESHSKLLEAVSQLDKGQRVKKIQRSEPTLEVSEFHLVKSGVSDTDAVQLQELTKALGKKGHHLDITKSLQSTNKKVRVLPKPLEKPAADRIKRIVGFENTKEELKKWNAVITRNRTAESLHFPLNKTTVKFEPSTEFVKRFRIQSELEKELAALEPQKENIEQKDDGFSLTLKEIVMKRKEVAKIRAQQSYKEAKARRQNKIKSKKFHRIQRKEKIKLQLKEFEELQKVDPLAALEKLEQLDKTRAEERMSLRHKNTGQWAKSKHVRAKYDKEARQELAQQLSISRELTQKVRKPSDSEEENDDGTAFMQALSNDKENPWTRNTKTESEIDDFIKNYRKYWSDPQNQLKKQDINVSTKNEVEVEQVEISTKDSKPSTLLNDHNMNNTINSLEIPNNEKAEHTVNLNKQNITSRNPQVLATSDDATHHIQSFEIDKYKDNKRLIQTSTENESNDLIGKIIKSRMTSNSEIFNKTVKSQNNAISKVTATSAWNVEPVDDIREKAVTNSMTFGTPNNDHLNQIFEYAEGEIKGQVRLKLEEIARKCDTIKRKRKTKSAQVEKDNFDGLEINAKKQKLVLDSSLNECTGENNSEINTKLDELRNVMYENSLSTFKLNNSEAEVDPNKYINVKTKSLSTDLPLDITAGNDALDDSEDDHERRNIVSEAFADDDVIQEFRKEKEEEVKKSQPEDINLTLPGWGSWGGKHIKISERKKKRFILNIPKDIPRRDENKGDVIIFENNDAKIKQHQVNELPYPFTTVKDYEASVRMPIGRNFVPENAHRKLIEPIVKSRLGKIIEPMTDDVLIKENKKKFEKSFPKRKTKIIRKYKINYKS